MKIGIDFDNTITTDPDFFSRLVRLLGKGNEIYVISSYERGTPVSYDQAYSGKEERLRQWGIPHKKLDLVTEPIPENKVKLCNKYGIDLMIDDDIRNVSAINRDCPKTVCLQYVNGEME